MGSEAMTFIFRTATENDLGPVGALNHQCFDASGPIADKYFTRAFNNPDWHLTVAEDGAGRFAGFLLTHTGVTGKGKKFTSVDGLAVEDNFRRRGLAKTFMAQAEAAARLEQCTAVDLAVRDNNDAAIKLYVDSGYKQYHKYEHAYRDDSAALCFVKFLEP
jgi:ribosomal protein S18 acetylase RimI-like enzyme